MARHFFLHRTSRASFSPGFLTFALDKSHASGYLIIFNENHFHNQQV